MALLLLAYRLRKGEESAAEFRRALATRALDQTKARRINPKLNSLMLIVSGAMFLFTFSVSMLCGAWTGLYVISSWVWGGSGHGFDAMGFVGSLYGHAFGLFTEVEFRFALPSFVFDVNMFRNLDWAMLWRLTGLFYDFTDFSDIPPMELVQVSRP